MSWFSNQWDEIVFLVYFQCRSVKISIFGESVPVQVDGEAWMQPPGYIKIVHKNRAQMLVRDRVKQIPFYDNCRNSRALIG